MANWQIWFLHFDGVTCFSNRLDLLIFAIGAVGVHCAHWVYFTKFALANKIFKTICSNQTITCIHLPNIIGQSLGGHNVLNM